MAKLIARVISAAAFLQLVAGNGNCRFYCLDSYGIPFCCETGKWDSKAREAVQQRAGMCPITRLAEASAPFECFGDHECLLDTDKCCFDQALKFRVCKPPMFYVDITSSKEEPIRVSIPPVKPTRKPTLKPTPKPKQPIPAYKPVKRPIYAPTFPHQPSQVPQVPQLPYYYPNRNPNYPYQGYHQ